MPSPERGLRLAAGLGLGLLLAVVVAAAGIRLGTGTGALRVVHRAAASLEVIVVLWLGWMAWRAGAPRPAVFRASLLAIGLTAVLSVIGIATGQSPPAAWAAANLLGGLALASVFAWLLGRLSGGSGATHLALASLVGVLLATQLFLGARLSIVDRFAVALPVHGLLALVLSALLAWAGLARVRGVAGKALFALALVAPIAGFTTLQYEHSAGAALAHAAAAAVLLATAAYAFGRGA
jgi:hypothetical protein